MSELKTTAQDVQDISADLNQWLNRSRPKLMNISNKIRPETPLEILVDGAAKDVHHLLSSLQRITILLFDQEHANDQSQPAAGSAERAERIEG